MIYHKLLNMRIMLSALFHSVTTWLYMSRANENSVTVSVNGMGSERNYFSSHILYAPWQYFTFKPYQIKSKIDSIKTKTWTISLLTFLVQVLPKPMERKNSAPKATSPGKERRVQSGPKERTKHLLDDGNADAGTGDEGLTRPSPDNGVTRVRSADSIQTSSTSSSR